MTARLKALLEGLEARVTGTLERDITDLRLSSREVGPGALFVAIVGSSTDGHAFVADAISRGAAAVLVSRPIEVPPEVTRIEVADTRAALTHVAARFFGDPSSALTLVGVTGTNGKTTSTYLLEAIFEAAGLAPGVIGTVNYRYQGKVLPAPNTTPDLVTFQRLLADMRGAGVRAAIAEVSSHALDQKRVDGLHFDAALFTNLSRDHLDYHPGLEAYFEAKARLFDALLAEGGKAPTVAVLNEDDPFGRRLKGRARATTVWGYSRRGLPSAELRVESARIDLDGIQAQVATPRGRLELRSPLLGGHNLENLLGVAGVALGLGLSIAQVEAGLAACRRVPGRLDEVENEDGIKVLVDYAHSDDALRNVLGCLRELSPRAILTVFGCGGERDRGKRPLMGAAASSQSELVVVTTDNPRGESPEAIIADIMPGLEGAERLEEGMSIEPGRRRFTVIVDRREAIRFAISRARPGDVVLIAGKGHEDYQIVGTKKLHFDDREEARAALGLSALEAPGPAHAGRT